MFFKKYFKNRKASKAFREKLQEDIKDPNVYTPGKPVTDSIGNIIYYKEYWFIDDNKEVETLPYAFDSSKRWSRIIRINNLNK